MNFRREVRHDEPEINLIPMIDVLLVILLFLMVTTSFSQISRLSIDLPQAAAADTAQLQGIEVTVNVAGRVRVNGQAPAGAGMAALTDALRRAAAGQKDPAVIISADAHATHQSVINVMAAARDAGLSRVTFAIQAGQ